MAAGGSGMSECMVVMRRMCGGEGLADQLCGVKGWYLENNDFLTAQAPTPFLRGVGGSWR